MAVTGCTVKSSLLRKWDRTRTYNTIRLVGVSKQVYPYVNGCLEHLLITDAINFHPSRYTM
jgi:hypothetical protein